ncbi:hypothetical protein B0H34DRAFT_471848 [Crassisporium funariophilum]|nr:hypothetical protein B0H34DRAFT_471848 [Crassisporium funariophilum]
MSNQTQFRNLYPLPPEPPALVQLPTTTPSSIRHSYPSRGPGIRENRVWQTSLSQVLNQESLGTRKMRASLDSERDVHNWDILDGIRGTLRDSRASSDTGSSSDDEMFHDASEGPLGDKVPCWDPNTGHWEPHMADSAWSDSDHTTEDVQSSTSRKDTSMHYPGIDTVAISTALKGPRTYGSRDTTMNEIQRPRSDQAAVAAGVNGPLSGGNATNIENSGKGHVHARPRNNERCRKWLRAQCDLGYDCDYVHDDLEYDDKPELSNISPLDAPKNAVLVPSDPRKTIATPRNPIAVPSLPRRHAQEAVFSTTLHTHIKLRFGSGFEVTELVTGFESTWLFLGGLPARMPDDKVARLLQTFGEINEIRRPQIVTSPLTLKVNFSKPKEAYKAFTTLHGSTHFGHKLDCRMALESKYQGSLIKDTAVRIDWDAPQRTCYAGYASKELAEKAIEMTRHTPYGDYMTTAAIHTALPAVGRVTVKIQSLPADASEEGMQVFGPTQGVVWERPNYAGYTVRETIDGLKRFLFQFNSKMVDFEVRPPPYRQGKMRAWVYFSSPNDAKEAAEHVHGRKPIFVGLTRIRARHIKTISYTVSVIKFRQVGSAIMGLAESVWRQGAGYSVGVVDKTSHFSVKLCGEDMKLLGRLKSELEKILNGEAVLEDGKVAWDEFFVRDSGGLFLQDLERSYPGVSIQRDGPRRTIRLFGAAEKRSTVREKILEKLAQLRLQKSYTIYLDHRLVAVFMDGELAMLQKELGEDNVLLDLWRHVLTVRGDEQAFHVAKDAVNVASQKRSMRAGQPVGVECPVCFNEASSPIELGCGHSWCRMCLQRYLKASVDQKFFPLTCLGNNAKCKERINLGIAREILSAGDFDAVVNAAFACHLQTHADEFQFCPTPDCPQVYPSAPEGVFLQCPACLVRICPNCKTDAHDGLTCDENNGGDGMFQEWVGAHDVKQCPGCKMAIEKDEGCNHMVCTVCQTHICWMCMKTFPKGEGIYGHMRSEHGTWGLGPIV